MWVVLTALLLMGVGCSDNSSGPSGNLACGDGEAWVITKDEALAIPGIGIVLAIYGQEYEFLLNEVDAIGIIFKPNHEIVEAIQIKWTDALVENLVKMYMGEEAEGEMVEIVKAMVFELVGGEGAKGWYGLTADGATWSQNGNNLIITDSYGESNAVPVTISGTALTITDPEESITVTLKKENIGTVNLLNELLEGPPSIPPSTGTEGDGNLVLGANEAWTVTDDGITGGYIFKSNGDLIMVGYMEELDWWIGYVAGTWSTSGSSITLTLNDPDEGPISETGTYSVSGNSLTITIDGETLIFTKTGGITYMDISGLMKSREKQKVKASIPKLFAKKTP
jgi:hypothetical protein